MQFLNEYLEEVAKAQEELDHELISEFVDSCVYSQDAVAVQLPEGVTVNGCSIAYVWE